MVDELRLQRLLRSATDTADFLAAERDQPEQIRGQRRWLDSIKYNFIAVIEACIDVGQHVSATQGWGPPETNAGTFRVLHAHGVVGLDVAETMARSADFRNVLVYQHGAVRDDLVIAHLDRLEDLRSFVAEISAWLLSRE